MRPADHSERSTPPTVLGGMKTALMFSKLNPPTSTDTSVLTPTCTQKGGNEEPHESIIDNTQFEN